MKQLSHPEKLAEIARLEKQMLRAIRAHGSLSKQFINARDKRTELLESLENKK